MKGFLLSILLLFTGLVYSQDPVISLTITTRDDDSGKKLAGATVIVKSGGSVFTTKTSASNGKVPPIDLPLGQNYVVEIKKDGYVTKVANIDGHFDYPEDLPPFVPFPIETSLFQKVEGVDFAWLETTPMIKFELDQYGNQSWDQAYTKQMLDKIEKLKKQLAEKKEEEEKKRIEFEQYVASGDKAVEKQEYQEAIDNYDKALALFDDADVKKKKTDAQKAWDALKASEETEKQFALKMEAAKVAYSGEQYDEAIKLYKEASGIKPNEQLPKDRIAEIEKILADQKAKEAEFNKLVKDGDAAVGSEDYDIAIGNYEAALVIKKDNAVQVKLDDARKKKSDKEEAEQAAKENEQKYNDLIANADKAFDGKSYQDARDKYEEALKLKPNESHPSARISQIDDILKKQKEAEEAAEKLEADYRKAIEQGDNAFQSKDWDQAIKYYEEALGIKPDEKYPKDQLAKSKEGQANEAEQAALDEKYNKLMSEGKSLRESEKFQDALAKYKEAQSMKPDESEPKDRIAELEKLIAEQADAAEKEEQYKKLMQEGADLLAADKLENALEKYESALNVKPKDEPAQAKINEINTLIQDRKNAAESDAKFKEYVDNGDKAFGNEKYTDAKANYEKALEIKDDQAVKDKIKQIEELVAKDAAAKELEEKYQAAIKEADQAFDASNWDSAIEKYEAALAIKQDSYPEKRIAEAKKNRDDMAAEAEKDTQFKNLVAAGDELAGNQKYQEAINKYEEALKIKSDGDVSQKIKELKVMMEEVADQAAKEQAYKDKIAEADEAFNGENWNTAKALYKEAIAIKSEQYPKDQILAIEKKIQDAAQNEKEAEYQAAIKVADDLRDAKKYKEAIAAYESAKSIKPTDSYPDEQINKIQGIISTQEQEAQQKEAIDRKYKDLMAEGEKELGSKSYEVALDKFQQASDLKPEEELPKEKIKEINEILGELNEQAAIDKKYDEALKKADQLFNDEEYKDAKAAYENALTIKPSEGYPKAQIAKCEEGMKNETANEIEEQYDKILKAAQKKTDEKEYDAAIDYYERALKIKPDDAFPKTKIAEIKKLIEEEKAAKELMEKYQAAVKKADDLFASEDFVAAKSAYQDALDIKSDEVYPKNQIQACEQKMLENTVDEEEAQYQKILAAAAKKFDEKDYEGALDYYKRAKTVRAADPFPQQKIDEITQLLKDLKDQEAQEAIQARYDAAIKRADDLFNSEEFKDAKTAYQDALDIKSNEQYPKDRIVLCEEKMKENTVDELEEQYQKILKAAQKKFDAKEYESALDYYERAKGIRPSDPLPQNKIDEINQILKDLASEKDKRDRFNQLVQTADNQFEKGKWQDAMQNYMSALDIFKEQYPEDQVAKCREELKKKPGADDAYNKLISKADEYFDATNYDKAKGLYKRAIKLKPSDQYPKDKLAEIDRILNPPADLVEKSNDLKDPGTRVNENSIDIEAMLMEAKEQSREYEIQQIYKQGEDADSALMVWTDENKEETFKAKEEINTIEEDISEDQVEADEKRQEVVLEVEEWVEDINKEEEKNVATQEDDIFYQEKKVVAMVEEIEENDLEAEYDRQKVEVEVENQTVSYYEREESDSKAQYETNMEAKNYTNEMVETIEEQEYEDDQARVEYLGDVEQIKDENIERERVDANSQENSNFETKDYTTEVVEEIEANDLEAEYDRQKVEIEVENQTVSYYEREEEDRRNQNNSNLDIKDYTEDVITEINENNLEAEYDRQKVEVAVENQTVAYNEREESDSKAQYETNMQAKDYTNEMVEIIEEQEYDDDQARVEYLGDVEKIKDENIEREEEDVTQQTNNNFRTVDYREEIVEEIEENDLEAEYDRQAVEVEVENQTVAYYERENLNAKSQEDNNMAVKNYTEDVVDEIEENDLEAEYDRQAVEKEVENQVVEWEKREGENRDDQYDNNMDAKDYTEDVVDKLEEDKGVMQEKSDVNNDKTEDQLEEYIEIVNETAEQTDEALIDSESEIDQQKELINVEQQGIESKNELGEKYPEGVTEESFTLNDARGLMKSYVIRRIVVIDGRGMVYEKTQTRHGTITYTRDGEPISEFMWNDETNDPKLTRN
ncbi:hypothetical protein K6119_16450 [Paracrocinitomix mangrovi]|uniref:hypothetical protein n=1 Tax=Paracrocinitomix mangrovi TaxID=2862509 RepID=UPI001C8ED54B|nr:hypothetical protein [Paracrocinitomix mangrovi]UKN01319.1 hypothetical protein K6119_16450 [Paracrocinitomix mangrovi]